MVIVYGGSLLEITPSECGIQSTVISQTKVVYDVAGGFCDNQYGDPPFTYDWNFGDGQTTQVKDEYDTAGTRLGAPEVTHIYAQAGLYDVVLKVTDSRTAHWDVTLGKTVSGPFVSLWSKSVDTGAVPLLADFAYTRANLTVDFRATPTGGTPPYAYVWEYGDDWIDAGAQGIRTPTHVYPAYGTYRVTLMVTDSAGQSVQTTKTLELKEGTIDPPPELDPCAADPTLPECAPADKPLPLWAWIAIGLAVVVAIVVVVRRRLF